MAVPVEYFFIEQIAALPIIEHTDGGNINALIMRNAKYIKLWGIYCTDMYDNLLKASSNILSS